MVKTIIVLPDGTEISSGVGTQVAISSFTLNETVNTGTDLTIGSVCANSIEFDVIDPKNKLSIGAQTELTVYREYVEGERTQIGLFTTEKPTRTSANGIHIVAYDRVARLDKDITQDINTLTEWPYTLLELARVVCSACGLTLINNEIPNGAYLISSVVGNSITGRQLLQYIGQVTCRFVRATAFGEIEFGWYQPVGTYSIGSASTADIVKLSPTSIELNSKAIITTDDGKGNISIDSDLITVQDDGAGNIELKIQTDLKSYRYFQGSLSFEDYNVAPIEKVQIKQSDKDIGVVYPTDIVEEANTYVISSNPLLTAYTSSEIADIASTIFTILQPITYVPCSVSILANKYIRAGSIVQVTDINNNSFTIYVMSRTQKGNIDTLKCVGSHNRESTTAVNGQMWSKVNGRILELTLGIEGLEVKNADLEGNYSSLQLEVSGIKSQVVSTENEMENAQERILTLEQTSKQFKVTITKIETDGADKVKTGMGYTFDDAGLLIAQEGKQMRNLLDNSGMYVKRGEEVMLQANNQGVIATDVSVRNYMIVGKHARFEDFGSSRTACFWLEG